MILISRKQVNLVLSYVISGKVYSPTLDLDHEGFSTGNQIVE